MPCFDLHSLLLAIGLGREGLKKDQVHKRMHVEAGIKLAVHADRGTAATPWKSS